MERCARKHDTHSRSKLDSQPRACPGQASVDLGLHCSVSVRDEALPVEGLPSLCGIHHLLHVTGGAKQHVACGLHAEEGPGKNFLQDELGPTAVPAVGEGSQWRLVGSSCTGRKLFRPH